MAEVQQDYTSMLEIGNAAVELQFQFDQLRQKLDRVDSTLEACWIGNAQVEVAIAYAKLVPKLDKVSKILGAYSTAIIKVINEEKETERSSSTQFRSIDSGYGF